MQNNSSPVSELENKKVLFIAMSKSQRDYFKRAVQAMGLTNASVVYVKDIPRQAATVTTDDQQKIAQCLQFKLDKDSANQRVGMGSVVTRFGFINKTLLTLSAKKFFARAKAFIRQQQPDLLVLWNGAHYKQQLLLAARDESQTHCAFLELGYLPATMVCDPSGVNAENSIPRDASFYRERPSGSGNTVVAGYERFLSGLDGVC